MRLGLALLTILALADAARAADPADKADAAPAPTTANFVTFVAQANGFELLSSQLVLSRQPSEPVRQLATRLIADHSAAADTFKAVLSAERLTLPSDKVDARHRVILNGLNEKHGAELEQAYLEAQSQAHGEAIAQLKAYGKGGENAALRRFADQTVPVLEQHRALVAALRKGSG